MTLIKLSVPPVTYCRANSRRRGDNARKKNKKVSNDE